MTRNERWQQHYDDFCMNECGGSQPEGRLHDEACAYADEQMEEEDGKCRDSRTNHRSK